MDSQPNLDSGIQVPAIGVAHRLKAPTLVRANFPPRNASRSQKVHSTSPMGQRETEKGSIAACTVASSTNTGTMTRQPSHLAQTLRLPWEDNGGRRSVSDRRYATAGPSRNSRYWGFTRRPSPASIAATLGLPEMRANSEARAKALGMESTCPHTALTRRIPGLKRTRAQAITDRLTDRNLRHSR